MSSSLHFYSEKEDIIKEESINKYKDIFTEFTQMESEELALNDVLKDMFINCGISESKAIEFYKIINTKIEEIVKYNYEEIKLKYPIISENETKIICSYFCELPESNYSPYKLVNKNLCEEDRIVGILKIAKYLFIFLKALRKLTRYYPKEKHMFRCITHHIKLDENKNKNINPYRKNNVKKFWVFHLYLLKNILIKYILRKIKIIKK